MGLMSHSASSTALSANAISSCVEAAFRRWCASVLCEDLFTNVVVGLLEGGVLYALVELDELERRYFEVACDYLQ